MQTIQQQIQVNFNAVEIKDAIKMCPIMDAILNKMQEWEEWEEYNSLSAEEKEGKKKLWKPSNTLEIQNLNYKNLDALLAMLQNLGFCTSY